MLNSFVVHRRLMADAALDGDPTDHVMDLFLHGLLTASNGKRTQHATPPASHYVPKPE